MSAQAAVTNITAKFTYESDVVGGTNNTTIKYQSDGSNKDSTNVAAMVYWYNYAKVNGQTTNDFSGWMKDDLKVKISEYVSAKAKVDFVADVTAIAFRLENHVEIYSQAQINQIKALAAVPIPSP